MKRKGLLVLAVTIALAVTTANAEFMSGFEPPTYTGSADGTVLTGQDGYYLPDASSPSTDWYVHTYAGNPLGIPANPGGGELFAAGTGLGDGSYARAQRTEAGTWGDGTGIWKASYDICIAYLGDPPSAQNIGSFSSQPSDDPYNPDHSSFIALAQWSDPDLATNWDANYLIYDASGAYVYPAVPDDPAFQGLDLYKWYRWTTTMDMATNAIIEIGIEDLESGDTAAWEPDGWYLGGGAAGGLPACDGFRLFAGGGAYGNTVAFDNIALVPEPAALALLLLGGVAGLRRR